MHTMNPNTTFDEHTGCRHRVFVCCPCWASKTTIHARLWPATLQYPCLAFRYYWIGAEALLLEWQVALTDLCKVNLVTNLYTIVSSLEKELLMFLWFILLNILSIYKLCVCIMCLLSKVELLHLKFVFSDLDMGNICTACPGMSYWSLVI